MTRTGKVLTIMGWLLLAVAGALLPPASAQAQCTEWDLSRVPQWRLEQGNGFDLMVTFQQQDGQVGGSATLYTGGNNFQDSGRIIDGSIAGNSLSFTIQWSKGGRGAYTATVSDGHLANGLTTDQGGSQATWRSVGTATATCIAEAARENETFCHEYANGAVQMLKWATEWQKSATQNQAGDCGLTGPRWDPNREAHFTWCMSLNGDREQANAESRERLKGYNACEALARNAAVPVSPLDKAGVLQKEGPKIGDIVKETTPAPPPTQPPAGGNMATVIADVDVYKKAGGGKRIGVLRSNNKTTKVSLVAPCQDNWCHVKGDPVPNGEGWVYSGIPPDFQSLQF